MLKSETVLVGFLGAQYFKEKPVFSAHILKMHGRELAYSKLSLYTTQSMCVSIDTMRACDFINS